MHFITVYEDCDFSRFWYMVQETLLFATDKLKILHTVCITLFEYTTVQKFDVSKIFKKKFSILFSKHALNWLKTFLKTIVAITTTQTFFSKQQACPWPLHFFSCCSWLKYLSWSPTMPGNRAGVAVEMGILAELIDRPPKANRTGQCVQSICSSQLRAALLITGL